MKWSAKLATGNESIDSQHQALLGCLGDLKQAMQENRTLFAVYTITRLKHHVGDHFSIEESLLRSRNAPELNAHMHDHQQFRYKLIDFQIKSIHGDVPMETVDTLTAWLEEHVMAVIQDYRAGSSTGNR